MQLSFALAGSLLMAVLSLPVQAVPAPASQATCKSIGSCVSALRSYSQAASLCSSWLTLTPHITTKTVTSVSTSTMKITTATATNVITASPVTRGQSTRMITATAATSTITASPVTVEGTLSTITAAASIETVTNTVSTTICGNEVSESAAVVKRSGPHQNAAKVVPSPLKNFEQSKIMVGCSCLSLTVQTRTVSMTVKKVATTTQFVRTASRLTITPTSDITADTTLLQTEITTYTPTTTSIPLTTVTSTSTSTIKEIKTIIIGPQVGTPTVVLASPTPITGVDSAGLATSNLDDLPAYPLTLPFELELYGVRSRDITVSINGWVALGTSLNGVFVNTPLPATSLPDTAFVVYWYDLYIYQGTPQGLYYEVSGEVGNRSVSIEWYTSLYQNRVGYTHFIATFFESVPGKAVYTYYQTTTERSTTNGQVYETIGAQSLSKDTFAQWSFDVVPEPGPEIELNTASNSFVRTNGMTCSV